MRITYLQHPFLDFRRCREKNNRKLFHARKFPQAFQERPAVNRNHHDIEKDKRRRIAPNRLQGRVAIGHQDGFIAESADQKVHHLENGAVILHEHDLLRHGTPPSAGRCFGIWIVKVLPTFTTESTLMNPPCSWT